MLQICAYFHFIILRIGNRSV